MRQKAAVECRPPVRDGSSENARGWLVSNSGQTTETGGQSPAFELTASRQFTSWMAEQQVSLAFTTYQAGKLFLLGLQPDGRLSVFERTFAR